MYNDSPGLYILLGYHYSYIVLYINLYIVRIYRYYGHRHRNRHRGRSSVPPSTPRHQTARQRVFPCHSATLLLPPPSRTRSLPSNALREDDPSWETTFPVPLARSPPSIHPPGRMIARGNPDPWLPVTPHGCRRGSSLLIPPDRCLYS